MKTSKKTGFESNIAFGPRSYQYYGGGDNPVSFIRDFYMYWNVSNKLKTTAGVMQPFIGYEADEPHENLNYSGSYAYSSFPPPSLSGLQFEYEIDENWGVLAGVYNSSLTLIDENEAKHFGAQILYSKGKASSIRFGVLAGKESDETKTYDAELVADFELTNKFFVGSNFLYHNQGMSSSDFVEWYMVAFYLGYELQNDLNIALRTEYVADPDGGLMNSIENKINALTLTLNWQIENLKIAPEFRLEKASQNSFLDENGKPIDTERHFLVGMSYFF